MKTNVILFILMFVFFTIISVGVKAAGTDQLSWIEFISEGTIENIEKDLSENPNINEKQNELGWTVLHAAVSFRRTDVVKVLVDMNADLNVQDNSGKTPLIIAVETGQNSTVDLLIESGANVNIADNNGDNPLSIAQKIKLSKIENVLKENNATLPNREMTQGRGNFQGRGMRGFNPNQNMQENQVNQIDPVPVIPENTNIYVEQTNDTGIENELDPNEVQVRIKKYPGLMDEVTDIVDGSKSSINQWRRTGRDNRTSLITSIRRQYEEEVEFIENIATSENASKTAELASNLRDSRKKAFIDINKEVRAAGTQSRTTTTTTRTNTRRTATVRTTRRGSGATTPQYDTTVQDENQYSPEIQAEIDAWINSNVVELNGRMSLMDSVHETILTEIQSLKQSAESEKAEKTLAAIDGLLVARVTEYNILSKEFSAAQQEEMAQENAAMQEMQDNSDFQGQNIMQGRGVRGR